MSDELGATTGRSDADSIEQIIMRLRVADLKQICRHEGLGVTGVKRQLQERVMLYTNARLSNGDSRRISVLRRFCEVMLNFGAEEAWSEVPRVPHLISVFPSLGQEALSSALNGVNRPPDYQSTLNWETSPFWKPVKALAQPAIVQTPHYRERISRQFSVQKIPLNGRRVCLLSMEWKPGAPQDPQPLYYPHNCETWVDNRHIPANTRGVRGQPGSAKPVDVTDYLRAVGATTVQIQFRVDVDPYRDDGTRNKSFAFGVYMVEFNSWEDLFEQVKARPHIQSFEVKKQIIEENDDGLETMAALHSLADPVLLTRIKVPARSRRCAHIDCFDLATFLQLQVQASTWKCPVCNSMLHWEDIAVDDYFSAVLLSIPESCTQISIESDGTWRAEAEDDTDETDDERAGSVIDQKPQLPQKPVEVVDLLSDDDGSQSGLENHPAPQEEQPMPAPVEPQIERDQLQSSVQSPNRFKDLLHGDSVLFGAHELSDPMMRASPDNNHSYQMPAAVTAAGPEVIDLTED